MKQVRYRIFLAFVLLIVVVVGMTATFLPPTHTAHASVSGFVTRSGTQFQLNGSNFRFSGTNIYWMALDENVGGVNYPTAFRVDDAFATAQEMGETVVRSINAASSVGCSLCLEPSLGSFNNTAFQYLDYAIKSAGDHGIRLILPLVDNYHYYAGGKHTFTDWRGISDENQFYTNTTVIADFQQFVSTVLNHVNTYTGVAYKNDPTILAWEEGNELNAAPQSWTRMMSSYIKGIDPNHLIGFSASDSSGPGIINQDTLSDTNIDFEDAHFYPMSVSKLNSLASQAENAGKAYYVGEFDWDNNPAAWDYTPNADSLQSFLSAIESDGAVGDAYFFLLPHSDTYGYVQNGAGFTLHYPGDTSDMQSKDQLLRTHAYTMRGQSVPADGTPGAPLITSVNGQSIAWRGSTPSASYSIERATAGSGGPWTVICNQCATDNNTPWTDSSQPSGNVWYRVRGYNRANVPGDYSPVYQYNGSINLVQNPGFETGDLTNWQTWAPSGQPPSAGVESQPPSHTGTFNLCEFNASSAFEVSVYQTIHNLSNGTYTLSAWVEGSGNQAMLVRDQPGGTILAQTSTAPTDYNNWHQISLSVDITGGQANIEFVTNASAGDVLRVDDVSFIAG